MSVLKDLLDDIQASEVKETPLSKQPYYNLHTMLYKGTVDQAVAELQRLQRIKAAALAYVKANTNEDDIMSFRALRDALGL